jgi:ABC-type dipeptide/oligopeptide/nickel transport system permease component
MAQYLARRAVSSLLVILGITIVSFVLIHLIPGDPVRIMLGGRAPQALIAQYHHELGLDRPLPEQYLRFVTGIAHGDLGRSIVLRRSVSGVVSARIGPTLLLMVYGTLIAILLALPLGIVSALQKNRLADHLIRIVTLVAFAMPPFWLGLILIRKFSLDWGLFPVGGYDPGFLGHLRSLTLPSVTIGFFLASMLIRSLRSSLIDVLGAEYVEAARARGLPEWRVIVKHALRNALLATITVLGVNLGFLIGGTVIVERVFDIPGIGQLLVESILTRDFPVIQMLTLIFGLLVVAINFLSDISYAVIDPRVRYR